MLFDEAELEGRLLLLVALSSFVEKAVGTFIGERRSMEVLVVGDRCIG